MSADNGVYILETDGPEFRVKHLQNIEDYTYNHKTWNLTKDENIHIENAREMWKNCKIHNTADSALEEAKEIYKEYPIVEYGISFIKINRKF